MFLLKPKLRLPRRGVQNLDRLIGRFTSFQDEIRASLLDIKAEREENEKDIVEIEQRALALVRAKQSANTVLSQKLRVAQKLDDQITEFLTT